MREILFRGKSVDNGKWAEGDLFKSLFGDYKIRESKLYDGDLYLDDYNIIPETVGQYTGLTDKNGTKIFEGDILSVSVREKISECGAYRYTGNKIETVWAVEYAERRSQGNSFYAFGKDRRFSLMLTKSVIYNANPEVIGNIHDNPELLEVEMEEKNESINKM